MSLEFDLVVIGAGPGGYVAAIRGAQLGLNTAVVEAEHLGGICLNWGCIPTKALLKSSEVSYMLSNLRDYGFSASDVKFDFTEIIKRSRDVSQKLAGGVKSLLKQKKVEVINGFAKFVNQNEIKVNDKETVKAKYFIIATGARARVLQGFEPDGKNIWTYKEAMTAESLPKSIIIVGSGAIGCEFASFYSNLGTKVTILESADRILQAEDEEISEIARRAFKEQGMTIITNVKLEGVKNTEAGVKVKYNNAELEAAELEAAELEAEKLIMAVGVIPNTEKLNLDLLKGVELEKSVIKTNSYMQTGVSNIFAIGDVTAGPWLAHKASHEGIIAAEKIASMLSEYDASKIHPINKLNIAGCTYTRPQIASVGLTEKTAKDAGYKVKVGKFTPAGNGKSIAMGETLGLVKTIFDAKTGELLGAHLIGAEVTEMISTFVIGKQMEGVEQDFMHTIFPHPSLGEMMHEAVLDSFKRAIHK